MLCEGNIPSKKTTTTNLLILLENYEFARHRFGRQTERFGGRGHRALISYLIGDLGVFSGRVDAIMCMKGTRQQWLTELVV